MTEETGLLLTRHLLGLDDLCVRFIINLPHEELTSVERICFQIEEAQWFYEDFVRVQDPAMPAMNLKRFCELIFQHCPLLAPFSASAALSYAEFLAYKTRVPVRGAIMLNDDMSEVVLVKGWNKKAKWSFPRGKINKEEKDLDCAIREVYEETGYDIKGAGLVQEDEENAKYIEMSLREQQMRLYVFRGVPMDTYFEPKTRKEISKISWYKVSELATSGQHRHMQQHSQVIDDVLKSSQFYMVAPFIRPLRGWIKQQKKLDQQQGHSKRSKAVMPDTDAEETLGVPTFDDGPMTTDAEDEGHFQRLLSKLQDPQKPDAEATDLPEVAPAASTADLSAQLKQMLSVGGGQATLPQPADNNPLMSLLRGGPSSFGPPQTPFEQIVSTPPQAHTPHHQHSRPPPYSEIPPPMFPYSPAQARHGMQPAQQGPSMQGPPMHWQMPPGQQQGFYAGSSSMPNQHHMPPQSMPFPPTGLFNSQIPAPQPSQMQQPMQNVAPQLPPHFPQYNQAPAAPAASQLPAPKFAMSNHAMNLLNTFKSPSVPSAHPVSNLPHIPASELPELDDTKPVLPSQLLGGSRMRERTTPDPPIHQPQAQKPRTSHQDALLDLFASPTPAPASLQTQRLRPAAAQPIELSAQPSPQVAHDLAKPVQHKLSMRHLPNLNTAASPNGLSPHLTSATVSGPLNAPDFETVKKNQPQKPVEIGTGIISPSPNAAAQAAFHPGAGYGRQQSGNYRQTATPPVPVHTVTHQTAMEAPRPFHPTTILRRSAQDIAEMAHAHTQAKNAANTNNQHSPPATQNPPPPTKQTHLPNFDRRGNTGQEQQQTLLDLFGGGSATAPKMSTPAGFPVSAPIAGFPRASSGIASPVSPLRSHSNLAKRQDTSDSMHSMRGGDGTLRSSRISSITSIPGEMHTGHTPAPTSAPSKPVLPTLAPLKKGSVAGDTPRSGAQSPITPVEKNFLLGYLQGVVKEGSKKGRQGSLR